MDWRNCNLDTTLDSVTVFLFAFLGINQERKAGCLGDVVKVELLNYVLHFLLGPVCV